MAQYSAAEVGTRHSNRVGLFNAEVVALQATLDGVTNTDLDRATQCDGWTVRDQIAHLADTDEVAAHTVFGGERSFDRVVPAFADAEAFTRSGCDTGASMSRHQLVEWSRRASRECISVLSRRSGSERVRWGFGCSVSQLAMGRTLEYWAHHGDIREALGIDTVGSTGGAACISELSLATMRWAFAKARQRPPNTFDVRLELYEAAGGVRVFGDADAPHVVRGAMNDWALLSVGRAEHLRTNGFDTNDDQAAAFVRCVRAYL